MKKRDCPIHHIRDGVLTDPMASAKAAPDNRRASQLVGSGSWVRLRSLGLVCVAQAGMALVLAALGIVDRWTVYPACYFSFTTFVGVWLMRDKPNIASETRRGQALEQKDGQ